MAVHIVVLTRPNADVVARLAERYPDHHQVTETCYLVQSKEITQGIATSVGLKGEDRVDDAAGVVFRLNGAYSGYTERALWEWLGQAEKAECF